MILQVLLRSMGQRDVIPNRNAASMCHFDATKHPFRYYQEQGNYDALAQYANNGACPECAAFRDN